MKTVLHVGKFYPPVAGGMERAVETLCRASRGLVESRVLVANTASSTVHDEVAGVSVTRIGTAATLGSVNVAPGFVRYLSRAAADLIVFHEPNPWPLLSMAIVRPRVPLVIWYHSEVVRPAVQYALFYAPMVKAVYAHAQRIVVSSPVLADRSPALAPYRDRVRVIPFGIEPGPWMSADHAVAAEAERRAAGGEYVLFAGRHVAYKGVDVLLRALAGTAMRAVIAGDGPRRAEWEALSRSLGVADRVTFTGEVSDARLKTLMHAASALVLPSTTKAEAFGYVQLEAMAAGVPVVSTNVETGVSWVNQHERTGLVVRAGDAGDLRGAIEMLWRDPSLRSRLGRAGRARVLDAFTVERLSDRLRALYEELAILPACPAAC